MSFFFSIITVCLNSEKTIETTIKSVLSQTFTDFEYIIIDGKSSDKTLDIINRYKDPRIKVISEKDKGLFDAMNKAIRLSKGKWIHILNSDDYYYSENSLIKASKVLNEKKTNYFQMCFKNQSNKIYRYYNWDYFKMKLYFKACIPHPSMIVSAKQYYKVGMYNLTYKFTSDHDFTLRLVEEYPGQNNKFILVTKQDGGITHQNKEKVIEEFRLILINNNFSELLSNLIYFLKKTNLYLRRILS